MYNCERAMREKYCYRRKRGYEERIEEEAMSRSTKESENRSSHHHGDGMKHRRDGLSRLHHGTAATGLLRCIGVFSLIDLNEVSRGFTGNCQIETYLTPDGRDHKVTGVVAIINETIKYRVN